MTDREHPGSPGRPPEKGRGEEARDLVEEVLKDQAHRRERQEAHSSPPKEHSGILALVPVVLAAAAVVVWLRPPELIQPPRLPQPDPVELEAGLRMDVYVAVLRIEDFEEETGRLPQTLMEATGDTIPQEDLAYARTGPEGYRVTGVRGGTVVVYESGQPVAEIVQGARSVVEGGGP